MVSRFESVQTPTLRAHSPLGFEQLTALGLTPTRRRRTSRSSAATRTRPRRSRARRASRASASTTCSQPRREGARDARPGDSPSTRRAARGRDRAPARDDRAASSKCSSGARDHGRRLTRPSRPAAATRTRSSTSRCCATPRHQRALRGAPGVVEREILVFTKPPYATPPQENVEGLEVSREHTWREACTSSRPSTIRASSAACRRSSTRARKRASSPSCRSSS